MGRILSGTVNQLGLAGQTLWVTAEGRSFQALATTNISSRNVAVLIDDNGRATVSDANAGRPILTETRRFHQSKGKKQPPEKSTIEARAIFTVDRPLEGTDFPEAQMLQRSRLILDQWDWLISDPVIEFLHYKDFYYWNGQRVSKIFTHPVSKKIDQGTATIPGSVDGGWHSIKRVTKPGDTKLSTPASAINFGSGIYYSFIFSTTQNARIRGKDGGALIDDAWGEIGINDSDSLPIWIAQFSFGNSSTDYADLELVKSSESYTVRWELYETRTYSNYFIASEKGVGFAHAVNGYVGDSDAVARYWTGNGLKPASLAESGSPKSWDWRAFMFTTPGASLPNPLNYETTAFYWDYYGSFNFNTSTKKGLASRPFEDDPDFSSPGRMIQRIFGIDPATQEPGGIAMPFSLTAYDVGAYNKTGTIPVQEKTTKIKNIAATIPLDSIPDFSGQIQDLCIPPQWSTNQAQGAYYQLPFLAVFPT